MGLWNSTLYTFPSTFNTTLTNMTNTTNPNTTITNTTTTNTTNLINATNPTVNTTTTNSTSTNPIDPLIDKNTTTTNTTTTNTTDFSSNTNSSSTNTTNSPNLTSEQTNTTSQNLTQSIKHEMEVRKMEIMSDSAVQTLGAMNDVTLQNKGFVAANALPASRILFKPLFMYFSNFDDLQLYNYMNTKLNPAVEQNLNTIKNLEEDKWSFIDYRIIWQDCLGLNLHDLQNFLNNPHRQAFTSQSFFKHQQQANGFFLNTLQFFLSNFLLILVIFIIGHLFYRLLHHFKFSSKVFLVKFVYWIAFPIMFMEGNVQYMSYLMGFEMENMWHLNFSEKMYGGFVLFWLFWFIFGLSTVYFFLNYLHQNQIKPFYENCKYDFRGAFYLNFFSGVRNISLGFVHYLASDDSIQIKFFYLFQIELLFLIVTIYSLKGNFFISKTRQWFSNWLTILRMMIILMFSLNECISSKQLQIDKLFAKVYGALFILYLIIWILPMLHELIFFISHLVLKYCKKKEKILTSTLNLKRQFKSHRRQVLSVTTIQQMVRPKKQRHVHFFKKIRLKRKVKNPSKESLQKVQIHMKSEKSPSITGMQDLSQFCETQIDQIIQFTSNRDEEKCENPNSLTEKL